MLIRSFATPLASPSLNLFHLFVYRNVAIAGQTLTLVVAFYGLRMDLPAVHISVVISLLALANVLTWARLHLSWQVTELEFFIQLTLDILALTAVLYFAGGSSNPFLLLYLLPLAITAASLPAVYAWSMAALAIACSAFLMVEYVPLPHSDVWGSDLDLHVLGTWIGFVVSAILIAHFVVKMANTLRERDRVLAETREKAIRDENILSMGTLAAGAAHELGSPLQTMAVVAKELEHDFAGMPDLAERIRILRDQIGRCKETLTSMVATAGQVRAESGRRLAIDSYLDGLITRWRGMRPQARVSYSLEGPEPAPCIVADQTLGHAIINILNNAADASIDDVEVYGRWSASELVLEICDRGPGFAPAVASAAGTYLFTTKGSGLGLGLFLVHATINRLDGEVQLFNREGGGACTRIILPLARLLAVPIPGPS